MSGEQHRSNRNELYTGGFAVVLGAKLCLLHAGKPPSHCGKTDFGTPIA